MFGRALVLLLCISPLSARADAIELLPEARHLAFGAELGFFTQAQDQATLHVLAPRFAAHYALDSRFSLAADYGLIAIDAIPEHGASATALRSGNASLQGLFRSELHGIPFVLGLGGTVPIAGIDRAREGGIQLAAFNNAQGMNGLWDVWLWAPSRAAALAYGSIAFDLGEHAQLELSVAPSLLIPVYEAYSRDPVKVFVPTAAGVAFERGPARFGLRVQAVIMPTNELDMLQVSIVPFVKLRLGAAFIEARYVGNVDEPLAGERGPRVWGFHLGAGGVL